MLKEEEEIDAFHRRQLRKVLNVKYPVTMRNSIVYRMTNESVLSVDMLRNRWKLFGHTLRMDEDTPAHKSMVHYFTGSQAGRFRGRPRVNMPRKLDEDLKKYSNDREELKSMDDLHVLKRLSPNRK